MVTHYQPLKYHGLINVPKVCVILGICLVFVVVWPEVDINISTYVQSTLSGASRELSSAALLGSPSRPERQLVAGLWEDIISKGLLYRKYTISLFVYRSPFYFLSDSKLSGWQQTVLLPLVSNSSSPRRQGPACSSCEDSPSSSGHQWT